MFLRKQDRKLFLLYVDDCNPGELTHEPAVSARLAFILFLLGAGREQRSFFPHLFGECS